ncbi:hypothetical protein DY000_02041879 [Brassica cretica]|uniref:IBB domain-containing protein n=1 Tax=Brassica cretica TaxID=69181 RepID=A0ABQ7BDE5_BRACR|nr:hypothetical protein DY000_02041879 [Brassica cretica]
MDTRQAETQLASSGGKEEIRRELRRQRRRDRSEAREERRLSDEAAGNANHKNRENPGEELPSTLKRRDAETKTGRPSPKEKARTPEAEPADHL